MASKTLYPHSLSQSSGSNIVSFNHLANLKNAKETYAKTNQIAKKSQTKNKPAAITAKNFKANIPSGSKINKVTVEYAADLEGSIAISKPTLNILKISGNNKKGKSLTKNMTRSTLSWTGDHSISNINSSDFGVKITFPENSKNAVGYVKLKYIRIIIDYTPPNFQVTSQLAGPSYVNEDTLMQLTISNVNKTKQGSNVKIELGPTVSYVGKQSGAGSISGSGKSLTWNTGIGSSSSVSIILRLQTSTTGNAEIRYSETATGHAGSASWETSIKPSGDTPDIPDDTPDVPGVDDADASPSGLTEPLQVDIDEEFMLDLTFDNEQNPYVKIYPCIVTENDFGGDYTEYSIADCTDTIYISNYDSQTELVSWEEVTSPYTYDTSTEIKEHNFKCTQAGEYILAIYDENNETLLKRVNLSVKPNVSTSTANFTKFKLTDEEIGRLGDGIDYTVQSFLKMAADEIYVRDWGKNFRIGVFNNIIDSNIINLANFSSFDNDSVSATLQFPSPIMGYDVTSSVDVNITYNAQSVIFDKADDNNDVTINIDFLDENEDIVFTGEYDIDFENQIVTIIENEYDSTDYSNLGKKTIFDNAEYWSNPLSKVNVFEELQVDFPYNEKYPVYILATGDYPQGIQENNIKFTEPGIIESTTYNGSEVNGIFPVPIRNVILNDESSDLTLHLFEKSNSIVLYDFPLGDDFSVSDTFGVSGIELTGDIEYSDQLSLSARLVKPDGSFGERSIIINDVDSDSETDTFSIGGKYDLWGFNISDMVHLEGWRIEVSVNNIFNNVSDEGEIKFKNIQLTVYSNTIKSNFLKVTVENENVRHLGMFVNKVTIPEGLNTDTQYLTIDGTDTNDAYRMNVKEKEIEIEFSVRGCNLIETTELLRQLAKLFVNERDELNNPIEKRIEFSSHPDVYFMYVMEEPFDVDPQVTDYTSKAKLTIPSGTSFAKEDTVTGYIGVNKGIAKVNPLVNIIPTGEIIEIRETVNDQKFKITYPDWNSNNTIQIDSINRKIKVLDYLNQETNVTEELDITYAGDIDNDWFTINNEFYFIGDNCIIQTVSFTERY